jgi:hypothetical protein
MAAASPQDFAADFVSTLQIDATEFWGVVGLLMLAGVLAAIVLACYGRDWLVDPAGYRRGVGWIDALQLGFCALREAEEFLLRRDRQDLILGQSWPLLLQHPSRWERGSA